MPGETAKEKTEPLISLIESRAIPIWEQFSLGRLAVTEPTRTSFKRHNPSSLIETSVKKRTGRKSSLRGGRNFNGANSYRELWEEDGQAIFNYPALVFVIEGQADFHIADYVVHCPQSHFLLFRDNVLRQKGATPHLEGENLAQRHCAVLWFFIPPGTGSLISYVCHSQGDRHWGDGYRIVQRAEVNQAFKLFLQEAQEKAAGYQPIAVSSFQSFLHLFVRELKEGRFIKRSGKDAEKTVPPRELSSIEQAKEYVKNHLNQPLTASHVAHTVYMSRNSFMQHFTRETGQTFHDYVTAERMQEARRLLSDGHWSIEFITRFTGLKPSQFRTQFKKRFGIAPSEFRKQSQTKVQNHRAVGKTGVIEQ